MSLLASPGIKRSLLTQDVAFTDADSTDACDYQEENVRLRANPYACCFGLSYPDHNYGAPPPPTPPPSPPPATQTAPATTSLHSPPPPSSTINGHHVMMDIENVSCTQVVVTSQGDEEAEEAGRGRGGESEDAVDDSVTRCICDFLHDDGYMIQCDRCSVWQHVDCMGVDRADIPDKYFCERCVPRKLNKQRAVQLQTKKREILMIDTSATESENETKTVYLDSGSSPSPPPPRAKKKHATQQGLHNSRRHAPQQQPGAGKTRKKSVDKRKPPTPAQKKQGKVPKSPVKANNRLRSSSFCEPSEQSFMPWESIQYADTYEEAPGNYYSRDVLNFLSTRKTNGQHYSTGRPPVQLRTHLYTVSHYPNNKKGLEIIDSVVTGEALAEYKGRVMLREQYNRENLFFQSHQPHVLFYYKLDGLDLCVDASSFGNDARHVRRSCLPNAEVRHFVDGSHLYFYIYASKAISAGSEITIPYDYNYQECKYGVECACNRINCPVERFHRSIITNTEEIPLQVPTKAAKKQKRMPKSLEEPLTLDMSLVPEYKSPVNSPPPKRRRTSSQNHSKDKSVPSTPVREGGKSLASPHDMVSPGIASPLGSDGEMHEEKPKLSREERKMEAIMKAFERMEKKQERRRESTHREPETPTAAKKTSRSNSSKDGMAKGHGKAKGKGTNKNKHKFIKEPELFTPDIKIEAQENKSEQPEIKSEVKTSVHSDDSDSEPKVDSVKTENESTRSNEASGSNDSTSSEKVENENMEVKVEAEEEEVKVDAEEDEQERESKVESDQEEQSIASEDKNDELEEIQVQVKEEVEVEGEAKTEQENNLVKEEQHESESVSEEKQTADSTESEQLDKPKPALTPKWSKAAKKKMKKVEAKAQAFLASVKMQQIKKKAEIEDSDEEDDTPLSRIRQTFQQEKRKTGRIAKKGLVTPKKRKQKSQDRDLDKEQKEDSKDDSDDDDEGPPRVRETRASRNAAIRAANKDQDKEDKGGKAASSKAAEKEPVPEKTKAKAAKATNDAKAGKKAVKTKQPRKKKGKGEANEDDINIDSISEKSKPPKPGKKKGKNNAGRVRGGSGKIKLLQSDSVSPAESGDDTESVGGLYAGKSMSDALPAGNPLTVAFKFPKTKKHMMSEWLSTTDPSASPARPAPPSSSTVNKLEPLEISTIIPQPPPGPREPEADFVKCVPSPHAGALSHLRRSSVSSGASGTKAVNSIPYEHRDTSMGSAKKRWLRQAMFERSTSSPVADKMDITSVTTSPPVADFVTPLKKRRFTRESMAENPYYTAAPSTVDHVTVSSPIHSMTSPSYVSGGVTTAATTTPTTRVTMSSPGRSGTLSSPRYSSLASPSYNIMSSPVHVATMASPPHSSVDAMAEELRAIVKRNNLTESVMAAAAATGEDVDAARMLLSLTHSPPAGNVLSKSGGGNGLSVSSSPRLLQKLGHTSPAAGSRQSCESASSFHSGEAAVMRHKDSDLTCSARISSRHNSGFSVSSMSSIEEQDVNAGRASNSQGFDVSGSCTDCDLERHSRAKCSHFHREPECSVSASASSLSLSRTSSAERSEPVTLCDSGGYGLDSGTRHDHVTCSETPLSPRGHSNSAIKHAQEQRQLRRPSFCSIKSPDSDHDLLNSSIDSSLSQSEYEKLCSSSSSSVRLAHSLSGRSAADRLNFCQGFENESEAKISHSQLEPVSSHYGQLFRTNRAADSSKDNIMHSRISHPESSQSGAIDSHSLSEGELNSSGVVESVSHKSRSLHADDASFREAEPKVVRASAASREAIAVSDLEEGELHDVSGEEVTSVEEEAARRAVVESEREEGEISSEDEQRHDDDIDEPKRISLCEEHDEVHSSSGALVESLNSNTLHDESSEADHIAIDAKPPSPPPSPPGSLPAAYRENYNTQDEVSSSRATDKTPIVYRKRNWWRDEDGRSPSRDSSTPTACSSSFTLNDRSVHMLPPRDAPQVDSTSSLDSHSQLASSRILSAKADSSRSPVVSSTNFRSKSLDSHSRLSVDSGDLSPTSGPDFPGLNSGTSQPQNKKKMSLLEYRKRMKARPSTGVGESLSVSAPSCPSLPSRSACTTPLYPTLPLFPQLAAAKSNQKATPGVASEKAVADSVSSAAAAAAPSAAASAISSRRASRDEEPLAKWSATATFAEQLLERADDDTQTRSLTERLRKEFGLENLDDSDNEEESSDDEPPPPPPPPRTEAPTPQQHSQPTTAIPSSTTMLQPAQQQPLLPTSQQLTTTMLPPGQMLHTLYPLQQQPVMQALVSSGSGQPGVPQGVSTMPQGIPQVVSRGMPPSGVIPVLSDTRNAAGTVQSSVPSAVPTSVQSLAGLPTGMPPVSLQAPGANAIGAAVPLPSQTISQTLALPSTGVTNPVSLQTPVAGSAPPPPPPPKAVQPPLPQVGTVPLPPLPSQSLGSSGPLPAPVPPLGSARSQTSHVLHPPTHTPMHNNSQVTTSAPVPPPPLPFNHQPEQYSKHGGGSGQPNHIPHGSGDLSINHSLYVTPNHHRQSLMNQAPSSSLPPVSKQPFVPTPGLPTPHAAAAAAHIAAQPNKRVPPPPPGGPASMTQQSPRGVQQADTGVPMATAGKQNDSSPSGKANISGMTNSSGSTKSSDAEPPTSRRPDAEYEVNAYGQGRCFLCDIELTSQRQASEHLSGRRHIRRKKDWEASAPGVDKTGALSEKGTSGVTNGPTSKAPSKVTSPYLNNSTQSSKLHVVNYNHGYSAAFQKG